MLIIFGNQISDHKKVRYALKEVFGIGLSTATKICHKLNIPDTVQVSELTELQQSTISMYIKQHYIVEDILRKQLNETIENYININSIKGFRFRSKLPVRGQRTHSNAKTCKKISLFSEKSK